MSTNPYDGGTPFRPDGPARSTAAEPRIPDCPLARTVRWIGEWWTLEVLHEVFDGHTRHAEIREHLRVSDEELARRMSALVARGLLEVCPEASGAAGGAYLPTPLGRSLRPLILVMAACGNQLLEPRERGMVLVDARTGEEVEPVVVDRTSGRRIDTTDHVFTAGPAASPAMRARYPRRRSPVPGP